MVVAIIAILAAMLLPALSKAREKARQAVCMNNLKQIYIAVMMYGDDNNDWLPPESCIGPDGYTWRWPELLKSYLNDKTPRNAPPHADFSYVNTKGPFFCPSTKVRSYAVYVSYGLNYFLSGDGTVEKLSRIRYPSRSLLLVDTYYPPNGGIYDFGYFRAYTGFVAGRHNAMANLLYVDGHIKAVEADWLRSMEFPWITEPWRWSGCGY